MEKFAAGDVVRLKSGGPKMTVTGENTRKNTSWPTTIDVCWFLEGAPKPEFGSFPAEALVLGEPRPEPDIERMVNELTHPRGARRRGRS